MGKDRNPINAQNSLAEEVVNEEKKLHDAKTVELLKKYRRIAIILVGIIAVSLALLIHQTYSAPEEPEVETMDNWSEDSVANSAPEEPVVETMDNRENDADVADSDQVESIVITMDNWSEYFMIVKETTDNSIVLGDAALWSMQINYSIRLKDYYIDRLDNEQISKIEFSLSYKQCFGLFGVDYKNLTYTEPDSFSAIKNCTANVVLEYPYSASKEFPIIYSAGITGGEQADSDGIGYIGKEFSVISANGTLYLKAER